MSQAIPLPQKPHEEFSYRKMVWTRFRKHHLATFGGGFLLFMLVLCFIGAPIFSAHPGLFLFLTVLSINFMGDGLRDALDPRLKGAR